MGLVSVMPCTEIATNLSRNQRLKALWHPSFLHARPPARHDNALDGRVRPARVHARALGRGRRQDNHARSLAPTTSNARLRKKRRGFAHNSVGGVEGIKVSHRFLKQELGFGSILNTFSAFFQGGNGKELHKTRLGQNAIGISSSSKSLK